MFWFFQIFVCIGFSLSTLNAFAADEALRELELIKSLRIPTQKDADEIRAHFAPRFEGIVDPESPEVRAIGRDVFAYVYRMMSETLDAAGRGMLDDIKNRLVYKVRTDVSKEKPFDSIFDNNRHQIVMDTPMSTKDLPLEIAIRIHETAHALKLVETILAGIPKYELHGMDFINTHMY